MDPSSVVAAGEALVKSIGNMTKGSTEKLQDVSKKVALVSMLDDGGSGNSNTNNADGQENTISSTNRAVSRGPAGTRILSDRGNNTNNTTTTRATTRRVNHVGLEALRDLRDLNSIVSEVEQRAAALRDAIDSHRRDNAARRLMYDTTRQQTAQLAATMLALPEHLPCAAEVPVPQPGKAGADATRAPAGHAPRPGKNRRGVDEATAGPAGVGSDDESTIAGRMATGVPILELVTVGELDGVPRSTRGRLTIEHVNGAVADIQRALEKRQAFVSRPRKKMSEKQRGRLEELLGQEVPAHEGQPFIAEPDLRALPAFKKGEMTAKALIATLRSLKRLKGVRGAGMMTYVCVGGNRRT